MSRHPRAAKYARESQLIVAALACLLALLAGCQGRTPTPQTDPAGPPPAPPEAVATAPAAPLPAPPVRPATPLRIAVLVSDDQPEYTAVARELGLLASGDELEIVELHGKPAAAREALARLRQSGPANVVAVGLLAARAGRELESGRMVFCQVFNHQEEHLLSARGLGIDAIPPLTDAVAAWRKLGATPKRVGVITGSGHQELVARAGKALLKHGIQLQHEVTNSDKETIVTLQRMLPDIDGYWLLPDNRVLSRQALRDVMAMTRRAGVDVLVHDPRYFQTGALISAGSDPKEIAQQAHALLRAAHEQGRFPGGQLQRLRRSRVQINGAVAEQAGYRLDAVSKALVSE